MKIRQLECFVRASELKSISQAAEQLNIAQTALGIQIRNLEAEFDTTLLIRTRRGVELTPAGKIIYEWSTDMLQRYHVMRQQLTLTTSLSKTLSLGLSHSVIATSGVSIVQSLSQHFPYLKVQIEEGHSHTILSGLQSGELDIGLVFALPEDPALRSTPLLVEELLLISSLQEAVSTASVRIEDFLERQLAIPSDERDVTRQILLNEAAGLGLAPNIAFEVQSIATMKQLVMNDLASAILPMGCVVDDYEIGRVLCQKIDSSAFHRTLFLVQGKTANEEISTVLASIVKAEYGKLQDRFGNGMP